ncbi:MAG TPA: catalase family protein [Actinomycetota bacterium]|nr:catalase family protein [Actinomycetota bacterium]
MARAPGTGPRSRPPRPAGTLSRLVNDLAVGLIRAERRIDPRFRPAFDRWLRPPAAAAVQALVNLRRRDPRLGPAAERELPGEAAATAEIIAEMSAFTREHYAPGAALRAGNTKTYGVVRGELAVRRDVPERLRHGIFAAPRTYRAWVRFAGPGPLAPPDLDDNGVLSIGIKLMGVEGPKLLDHERWTQDLTGISAPTFTTPDVVENAKLQRRVREGVPVWYFLDPFDSHLLDGIMQGLWSKTHANPLEAQYYSCAAYLLGEGQAMQYSVRPRAAPTSRVPRRPGPDYLRAAMAATLARQAVELDLLVQLQTDPFRMPVENASVRWPERRSPFVPVATLRLPSQRFDSPAQLALADSLSYNPWHCIPAHRPLGNQNRARKAIYLELSALRQTMNGHPHVEPTGDEVFDQAEEVP